MLKNVIVVLAALYCAAFFAVVGSASGETLVPAMRSETPPRFNSTLSASLWGSATHISQFTDVASRSPARSRTEAAVYYDDTNVYITFWCSQDAPLTATQTTHNVGFGSDDFVGIGIDPSGNGERAYYFEVTPLGTRYAQASETTRYLPRWNARVAKTERGWSAMLIVPFAAMKLSAAHRQTWRINAVRGVIATGEKLSSSYNVQMDVGAGFPDLADARYWKPSTPLEISTTASRGKPTVDVYGIGVVGTDRRRFIAPDTSTFTRTPRIAGIDFAAPLTGTLSLVGTLSPDFSNVDADQVTIVPQIYQRNLTEYRPFFAQGANYINNAATALAVNEPANVTFYSPSIGAIDQGLKLEGTYGDFQSLGLLEVSGTNTSTGEPFHDMAFGWKHILPKRAFGYWTNGAIASHGALHDSTIELGAQARDLRTGWVGAFFHESEFTTLGADKYESSSTSGFIDHQNDHHEALIGFRAITPRFQPADGFTQLADIRGLTAEYTQFFGRSSIDTFADRYVDSTGAAHKSDTGFTITRRLLSDTVLTLGHVQTEARSYDGSIYTGFPAYKNAVTQTFEVSSLEVAFHAASPSPVDLKYSWGPYGNGFLQQVGASGGRTFSRRIGASWEYDTAHQRSGSTMQSQSLYRLSLAYSLSANSSFVFGLRSVTGDGVFSQTGVNVTATLHRILENGDEFYASYGSPAANSTLRRLLVKYVFKSPR
jgi:hypothetical protein